MGNGNRAIQKRERNAKEAAKGAPKSQIKQNEAAKTIQCMTCRQTFLMTVREPALLQHADGKHSKTVKECFPMFTGATA